VVGQDLRRTAFVTRRFADLQGFNVVIFGAVLVASFVWWSFLPAGFGDPVLHMLLPAQLTMLACMPGVQGFYARSFGRVPIRASTPSPFRRPAVQPVPVAMLVVLFGVFGDMFGQFGIGPHVSFGCAGLTAYSLWIVFRDWPYRGHYLIAAGAGIGGMLITSTLPQTMRRFAEPMDPAVASQYALAYALAGLGLVAVGLLDHRLLALAMGAGKANRVSPDPIASRLRVVISATSLLAVVAYVMLAGWPREGITLYMAFYLAMGGAMAMQLLATLLSLSAQERRASLDRARTQEARLLAQIGAMRGDSATSRIDPPVDPIRVPCFDFIGHFVLPLAMGSGALIDVLTRGSGLPSALAIGIAASQLRVATRDWPRRAYYLVGTITASISAVHHMFVGAEFLDWALWLLIFVGSAMLLEGLLDLRLFSLSREILAGNNHADAV
jgi:hypothetical protein